MFICEFFYYFQILIVLNRVLLCWKALHSLSVFWFCVLRLWLDFFEWHSKFKRAALKVNNLRGAGVNRQCSRGAKVKAWVVMFAQRWNFQVGFTGWNCVYLFFGFVCIAFLDFLHHFRFWVVGELNRWKRFKISWIFSCYSRRYRISFRSGRKWPFSVVLNRG